jgi:hypothetical protein
MFVSERATLSEFTTAAALVPHHARVDCSRWSTTATARRDEFIVDRSINRPSPRGAGKLILSPHGRRRSHK